MKRDPENTRVHNRCSMNEHRRAAKRILSIDGGGEDKSGLVKLWNCFTLKS